MSSSRGESPLGRRSAVAVVLTAAMIVLALMAVFAIELANTQAKSRGDVIARVHDRGVLAAALISSLFSTVVEPQALAQDRRLYGGATVSDRTLQSNVGNGLYLALLDPADRVLASSRGFTGQARSDLRISAALALVRSGHKYGLGDQLRYGSSGVINLAVPFPTRYGTRILLTGADPRVLAPFLDGDLHQIPGVAGSHNYVLDSNETVLGSTYTKIPVGFHARAAKALRHSSGDVNGHFFVQVKVRDSTWRILLSAPTGPLFASVSGLRKWVPWIIFAAFALVAVGALVLGLRLLRSSEAIREAKAGLEVANRQLEASNDSLQHRAAELARSNAELDQFASIASHDLQEPLRKVRTFTEQVSVIESDHLSEKGHEYLQRANDAAARMQKLIQDLLAFSRVTTQGRPFTPVDLGRLTHEVLEDLSSAIERSGAVVHVGDLPTLNADALQMRQLIQNLLSNALKFRRDDVQPEVWTEARLSGQTVQLIVRDNGIGFEQRYAGRIFRIFERLHGRSEYPGTGIGLALCRKIAERHGGGIQAESEPGAGATFVVTLPLHAVEVIVISPSVGEEDTIVDREEAHVHA